MKSARNSYAFLSLLLSSLWLYGCGGGSGDGGGGEIREQTFTLEGTIQTAAGSAVDGDVNDPLASLQPNNDRSSAQSLPNPVTLGGYVNLAGVGSDGVSRQSGDRFDWFRVSLAASQQVNLFIGADNVENDLELGIFDLNDRLVDADLGQGKFKSLTVNQSGDYFLLVQASRGASNYLLTIGQRGPLPTGGTRLSDAFVPGEIIVRFTDSPTLKGRGLQARAQSVELTAKAGDEGRSMLLNLTDIDRTLTYKTLGIDYLEAYDALQSNDPEQQLKRDTLRLVKALNRRPDVLYATPNYLRQSMAVNPNDPLYPLQWHYPLLNLPQAWDLNTGDGALVAVIDSGVLVTHPDLQGQLLEGYDFIKNPADANDGDSGVDPDPNDPGDGALPSGSSFHGTHVAGTIAATTNNAAGIAGSAFLARLMPLRVAGRLGIATDYDVEQAVRFAARLPNDSGTLPPRRADVINLSLGGPAFSEASEAVFNQARAAGVAIVAAAGNEASSTALYPASYAGVISVSAVDINKALTPYSNFGPFIDVAAPGGDNAQDINGDGKPDGVLSTAASDSDGTISPNYVYYSGTSMAAAHMSGVIALMRSANPRLTPQDIDNLLISGALTEDLGTPGRDDRYGHGLINAYRAVVAASNTPGGQPVAPIPILVVNPTALNFGLALSGLTLTVGNGGGGDLKVNPPSENSGGWLRLSAAVDGNGLGSYTLTVDRANLPDGLYTATLTFTSNANTVQVPVIMQIAQNLEAGDVGPQYVLLVEPATLQTKSQAVAVRSNDGRYSYRLENIPAGTYQIFAGSDLNNDGFICDSGESCGAYITLDKPIHVQVNDNRSDLDFASGFTANLTVPNTPTTQAQSGLLRAGSGKRLRSHR